MTDMFDFGTAVRTNLVVSPVWYPLGMEITMDLSDGYRLRAEWPEGITSGGPRSLVVEPVTADGSYPHGGISSTLLREINVKKLTDLLREAVGSPASDGPEFTDSQLRPVLGDAGRPVRRTHEPG